VNEFPLLLISFVIYLLVMLTGFASFFGSKTKWTRISYWLAMAGLIVQLASLLVRTMVSGHAPFTNMYESINFLSWSCALVVIIFQRTFKLEKPGPISG